MRPITRIPLLALLAVAATCGRDEPTDLHGAQAERVASPLMPATGLPRTCCVPAGGATSGMCGERTPDNWCCGQALCTDREACGSHHGRFVPRCADCSWYNCSSASAPGGGTPTGPDIPRIPGNPPTRLPP